MQMKYEYDYLDIDYFSVAEAIAALQAWEAEHPDAVEVSISLPSDGGSLEINYQRPMTEIELSVKKIQEANHSVYMEERDRIEYERLKAKFEGN